MDKKDNVPDSGFPLRFDQFLKAFKLNTNKLATELNDTNPVKFRRWLAGEVNPSYEGLYQICTKYSISLDWLAFGQGSMLRGSKAESTAPASPMPTTEELGPNGKPWKEVAEEYRVKYEKILIRFLEKNHPELFADQEGVKIGSGSHVTAWQNVREEMQEQLAQQVQPQPNKIGFDLPTGKGDAVVIEFLPVDKPECKVINFTPEPIAIEQTA